MLNPFQDARSLASHTPLLTATLRKVAGFGIVTNLLMLAPTVYMLQVYGRAVNSRSETTLVMLTLLVVGCYVLLEMLDWVRQELLQRLAFQLDGELAPQIFQATYDFYLQRIRGGPGSGLTDLASLRAFISSNALLAVIDTPFALLTMLILFAVHPWFGIASLASACLLTLVGVWTERHISNPLKNAQRASISAQNLATNAMHQASITAAMGMQSRMYALWQNEHQSFLLAQAQASDAAGLGAAISKFVQSLQGSLLLGLGCWLTLMGSLDTSGSMMIVGSVLGGRMLTPIAQLITQWRQVAFAHDAYQRIDKFLGSQPMPIEAMALPAPTGHLTVESLSVLAPGSQTPLLRSISFDLPKGEILALVGPSGAGKTTLTRHLVGLGTPASGKVRLDGVDIHTWNKSELGPAIGYLPQSIELFEGTLKDNISRFFESDSAKIDEAIEATGLQEFIDMLPEGLETKIGYQGAFLSGGMRQRVGLARALYGSPKLLVLDEPNANLDDAGEASLIKTLMHLKSRGVTVVLVTHRSQLLTNVDQLMILRDGQIQAYGPRVEVLTALRKAAQARSTAMPQ